MYYGKLPDRAATPGPTAGARAVPLSRRRVLLLGTVFAAGGLGGGIAARWLRVGAPAAPVGAPAARGGAPAAAAPPPRGSLAWALALADADAAELLAAAGDLERVSARHRDEDLLVPGFERLLDLALRTADPGVADRAAACAIRSLVRHGRADLAVLRGDDLDARPPLVEAARALTRARTRSRSR